MKKLILLLGLTLPILSLAHIPDLDKEIVACTKEDLKTAEMERPYIDFWKGNVVTLDESGCIFCYLKECKASPEQLKRFKLIDKYGRYVDLDRSE